MWARISELIVACWLFLGPFVLSDFSQKTNDYICAFLTALFALLSFWDPLRKIHVLTIGVGLWLWGSAYSTFPASASPMEENSVIAGALLVMLAIVPSGSHLLSRSWHKFDQKNKENL
ncbi:MAG: hypothetical protein V4487_05050 [Chlamydiota bacterium]